MPRAHTIWPFLLALLLHAQKSVPIGGIHRQPTYAVIDSPEIRKLMTEEEQRQAEADKFWREKHSKEEQIRHVEQLALHPDLMLPGHKEFLGATGKAPHMIVPGKTRARVLEISKARCEPDAFSTIRFVRVMHLGKKPFAGTEVWACIYPYAFEAP